MNKFEIEFSYDLSTKHLGFKKIILNIADGMSIQSVLEIEYKNPRVINITKLN